MTLLDFAPGDRGTIQSIDSAHIDFASRMYSLGMVPGQQIQMLHQAPFGDPMQVRVGQTLVSIRRRDAEVIKLDKDQ